MFAVPEARPEGSAAIVRQFDFPEFLRPPLGNKLCNSGSPPEIVCVLFRSQFGSSIMVQAAVGSRMDLVVGNLNGDKDAGGF